MTYGMAPVAIGIAEVGEVPLQQPAESTMLLSDRPRPHEAAAVQDFGRFPPRGLQGATALPADDTKASPIPWYC